MFCRLQRYQRRLFPKALAILIVVTILFIAIDHRYDAFYEKKTEDERVHMRKMRTHIDVKSWMDTPTVGCDGNFYGYGEEFVRLRFARVDPHTRTFSIPCKGAIPRYTFQYGREGTPLQSWHDSMLTYPESVVQTSDLKGTTTIAIMRIEAHNLYHTMCEWYNVFLLSKLLYFNPSNVDILLMDDRPPGHMDETWSKLFRNVYNYSSVSENSVFKDLIWNAIGYESPMNHHFIPTLPYLREFRLFYLNSFKVRETKALNCDRLTVTVLLRRDYMTHPERLNMTGGLVHRKFKNEDDVIRETKLVFKGATMNIIILEKLSMKEQLQIISNTDVLIGMHGAGMSHILFLPRHAVVFEIFPKYWGFYHHFKAMARWRKIKYYGWQNTDDDNEFPDFYTHIPPEVVRNHCRELKTYICGYQELF